MCNIIESVDSIITSVLKYILLLIPAPYQGNMAKGRKSSQGMYYSDSMLTLLYTIFIYLQCAEYVWYLFSYVGNCYQTLERRRAL